MVVVTSMFRSRRPLAIAFGTLSSRWYRISMGFRASVVFTRLLRNVRFQLGHKFETRPYLLVDQLLTVMVIGHRSVNVCKAGLGTLRDDVVGRHAWFRPQDDIGNGNSCSR